MKAGGQQSNSQQVYGNGGAGGQNGNQNSHTSSSSNLFKGGQVGRNFKKGNGSTTQNSNGKSYVSYLEYGGQNGKAKGSGA